MLLENDFQNSLFKGGPKDQRLVSNPSVQALINNFLNSRFSWILAEGASLP